MTDQKQAAASLETVTDYHEEKEFDASGAQEAMANMEREDLERKRERVRRQVELAKIKVKQEDIDIVVRELEITEKEAQKLLREHNNNIIELFDAFIQNK